MAKKRKTKTKTKATAKIDVDLIRQAAVGRWPEILASVAGIPAGALDGGHHPCPKCGGTDRFRLVDKDAGAVLCNQCFSSRNGDGFAALQWMKGIDFLAAVWEIADYLGIDAKSTGEGTPKKKPPPDEHLDFRPWNDVLVALWCRHKPPITPKAVKAAGGRLARYREQYTVMAFPVWGQQLDAAEPVGWALFNTTGKALPKFTPSGQVEWITKPKLTYGSAPGVLGDLQRLRCSSVVWKLEGVSDMLAWLSMPDLPPDHAVITNANGAQQRPAKWMTALCEDKLAYVLHDADKPGQDGAVGWEDRSRHRAGWAEEIAEAAKECRNVMLPYPMAETHGKDFRDWLTEGGTFAGLRDLADRAMVVASSERQVNEAVDDPYRLARVNLDKYAARMDGRTIRYWSGSWWTWKNCRYLRISENELRAKLTASIKEEFDRLNLLEIQEWRDKKEAGQLGDDDGGPPLVKKVTPNLISAVLNATRGIVYLSGEMTLDSWIPAKERRSYISMGNGILDVEALMADKDEVMQPHSPEWFSPVQLPYAFDPHAACPKWEAFLEKNLEMDPERIKVLQEWAGYLLLPDTSEQRFLILEGEGANGKSVFCAGIEAMLGEQNCSYVLFEEFSDKFEKTETLGKLVNICGDVGEIDKMAEGVIKAFTSGNRMLFQVKGKSGIQATPTARLMIACNNRPRFSDRSKGIWRRVLIVPWKVEIEKYERILNMDKPEWWRKSGELPGIFRWAVLGLYRLRNQGGFSDSAAMQESLSEYQLETNPTKQFLLDYMEEQSPSTTEKQAVVKAAFLYRLYRQWATDGGYRPLADRQFGKEVRRAFPNVRRVRRGPRDGRVWSYVGIDFREGIVSGEDLMGAYVNEF